MDPKAILDSLEVGVAAVAPDWTIADWSAPATRITGLTTDQALGRSVWGVFPTAAGAGAETILRSTLADGVPRTYLAPLLGAETPGRVLEMHATRGPHDHLVLLFRPVQQDLAHDVRTGQLLSALETERRLYEQLFSLLPSPALMLTVDGQILEANPEAAGLFGASEHTLLQGRSLTEWVTATQRTTLVGALRDAMGSLQRIDLTIEVPQEPVREVKAVIANIDPASAPTMLLFLAVDVSQETLLQRKLVQTDRLSQLGALVSGVAHELNNPLAAIAAFAELLSTDALDPQLRESATIIHSEAMRGGRIVQTLLDFARQRPRVTQAVDLKNIAERVLALHRSALKKARVRADIIMPTDVPLVMGDPQELQQVLLNAVVNAQQAIESTGQAGRVAISARTTDHHVLLTIDDTGPGVPTDILDRVFDPFFTTKGDQGTGLGLAITHGLVKAMGGRVWIQNIEGGGARVAIELPAGLRPPDEDAQGGFHPAARPLSVLVVEDENSVRRGMVLMAERLGHRVRSAPGYDEALEELALGKPSFDALLVDVHLDDAHSGFDLFDRLKDEGQGLERHVVFTTGDSISSQTRDRLERSQRPILRKPFSLDELRDVLGRASES